MTQPMVDVILPCYNRARFLPEALQALRAQTFPRWRLILIDDGSTDDTRAVFHRLTADLPQPWVYVHQENQGLGAVRNRGLDEVTLPYVAFFDSDDLWLPHHLHDVFHAIDAHPDVHWVFTAGKRVDLVDGRTLMEHSFYPQGQPRELLSLPRRASGKLWVLTDHEAALRLVLRDDHLGGLQGSIYRAEVFKKIRFPVVRLGEDLNLCARILACGLGVAYLDQVDVVYRMHTGQSSNAGGRGDVQTRLSRMTAHTSAIEMLLQRPEFTGPRRGWVRRRAARQHAYDVGYNILWSHGHVKQAMAHYRRAIALHPTNPAYWKLWLVAALRRGLRRTPQPAGT